MASVASRNLFDILADNEDVEPVVSEKEPTPKENVVVQKKVDRSRASPKEARIRHEYPQRGGFKPSPNNRNEDTRSGAPRDRNVGPRLSNRREEGGGGDYPSRTSRGARTSERGRGGRGNRRGREYDRHSGTGKYDSEKKENQGWGNGTQNYNTESTETTTKGEADTNTSWGDGTANDSTGGGGWGADTTEGQESGVAQDNGSGWEAPTETAAAVPEEWDQKEGVATNGEDAPVVEQEESFKTLDEYRAEKAPKAQIAVLPEARKANEGVDDSQWKDAVPLEKDDEDDTLFAGKEHSFRLKSKKSKAKNFLEIEQTFTEKPGSGPRGRGRGRGGNRGRGDRRDSRDGRDNYEGDNRRRSGGGGGGGGGGRGSRGRARGDYVNLDDQRAFPSLGAA